MCTCILMWMCAGGRYRGVSSVQETVAEGATSGTWSRGGGCGGKEERERSESRQMG